MNTAEILRAAAGRVRQGWTQRALLDWRDMGVCAVGGVVNARDRRVDALYEKPSPCELAAIEAIGSLLRLPLPIGDGNRACAVSRVTQWNDGEGQTAENVAAGMEYAALLWEQTQAQAVDEAQSLQAVTD